ncbi:MAG TPA: efflux RND transporter permease subunit [Bdellovibrionota bacterium]|nr:efflux RND transporter permease subunit [Bdellovibrionota bacterium]
MNLSEISIRRPVFAWMLMSALIIFGFVCFGRMGISQLPDVDFPVIAITARYPGAAPEVMEADVVDVIEDSMMSIEGIKTVTSMSRNGISTITLEFQVNRNIDIAMQDVQAKIAQVQLELPRGMDPVTIMKINPDDFPIMWLSASNTKMSTQELMIYVRDHIRDAITTVPGVGSLWTPGYLEPNLRVWVKDKALDQFSLTVDDVVQTIRSESLEPPGGRLDYKGKELNLRTMGEAKTPDDFGRIYIKNRGGMPNFNPVPINRVASIVEGTEDIVQFARANARPAIGLGVIKQRGSNAVEVAQAVKAKIRKIQADLPEGTVIDVNFDATEFIEESVGELTLTLVLAALLTSLVCWLFLGSWSATLNVILAIPTSILGSFIILYSLGFTLNMFTLLGLSLAIGIVVDDAIMVLENIVRHREMGKSRFDAALFGTREIAFAAMAATVSLVAIFLPIALMQGIIGMFLYQFGVTMSAAVLLSLLEALTLTPMRASKFIEPPHRTSWIGRSFESSFHWARERYVKALHWVLENRWKTLLASLVFFVISFGSVAKIPKEFQPAQDQSMAFIQIQTPVGSAVSFTDRKIRVIEDFLLKRPEVNKFFAAVGGFTGGETNTGIVFISLHPKDKRKLSQVEFIQVCRDFLNKEMPESLPQVQDPSQQGFSGGSGFPIEFAITGPDWTKLGELADQVVEKMKKTGTMTDVKSDYQGGAPELQIVPNRQKANERGVSVEAIGVTVSAAIAGAIAGRYPKGGHRYDIRVKLQEDARPPIERIKTLNIRNNRGELVALPDVVDIVEKPSAAAIMRKNRSRAVTFTANMAPGKSQQEALDAGVKVARETLPEGYGVMLSGSAEEFAEAGKGMMFMLAMGLLVAYMVLASQFNSFIDPITVFMALPFSFSGAFLALLIGGQSLNIFSMIGLVLLMGIVKKNSILLVDYTNQKRDLEHVSVKQALLEACPVRLRPILMTSFATIAGALPAALSFGPGAEARAPMSIGVMGGVFVSTILTLLVVPAVYSLLARFDKREKEQKKASRAPAPDLGKHATTH